jgi:hemoglobin-like flavoprotein
MKIAIENKQRIHDVLLSDMQRRIFKQYNERKDEFNLTDEDYDTQQTILVDWVLQCDTLNDVNELVLGYTDLFDDYDSINVFTLEGTMNYIFKLLR